MPISNKPTLYYLLSYVAFLIAFSVLIFFIKKKYSAHKITERAVSALGMKG